VVFSFSSKFEISKPQVCSEFYSQPDCRMGNVVANNNESDHTSPKSSADTFVIETAGNNVFSITLHVGTSPYSRFNVRFSPNLDDYEVIIIFDEILFPFSHSRTTHILIDTFPLFSFTEYLLVELHDF